MDRWAKTTRWRLCRNGPWTAGIACGVRRSRPAGLPVVGAYCVSRPLGAIAGSHDAALEFSANIGKWQLRGVDLTKFGETGEMPEFEVMVRPIKALAALGGEMGNRIGPQRSLLKAAGGYLAPNMAVFEDLAGHFPRLRPLWPCGKDRRALSRSFGRFSYPGTLP
jgi:hypothetical protein